MQPWPYRICNQVLGTRLCCVPVTRVTYQMAKCAESKRDVKSAGGNVDCAKRQTGDRQAPAFGITDGASHIERRISNQSDSKCSKHQWRERLTRKKLHHAMRRRRLIPQAKRDSNRDQPDYNVDESARSIAKPCSPDQPGLVSLRAKPDSST